MTRTPWPPPQSTPHWARAPAQTGPNAAEIKAIVARFNAGRFAEVEASARTLTGRFPLHAFGWKVLGAALKQQGRLEDALAPMRQAITVSPKDAEAHGNLGIVLLHLGRLAEAEPVLRQALELKPDHAAAHSNLGAVLLGQGRPTDAEASYRRTLEFVPDYAETHSNLAIALLDQGRLPEAEASLRRALALAPDYTAAHSNLGAVLSDQGRAPDSVVAYRRAWAMAPRSLEHAIRAHLQLPIIEESRDTIAASRARYEAGIRSLDQATPAPLASTEDVNLRSFFLAYHDADDRPIMDSLQRLLRAKVPNLTMVAPDLADWRPPQASGRRLKVGFLSKYFSLHTIAKLFGGFVRHLDRSRFEVTLIHANRSRDDEVRREFDTLADRSIVLPAGVDDQQRAVAAERLDVLFYPDVAMSASSYFLAFARLAPVQAMSFGHPDTTGLETMDYFVSGAPMEPEGADDHYAERLIRLTRLPSCYPVPAVPETLASRAELGLPEGATLYGCPQSLFKLHPDFDPILAAIVAGDPDGHVVLIEGSDPNWSRSLLSRWRRSAPGLAGRVTFLPHLPPDDFMALLSHIDVGLDPVHFGGGNTFYEAMAFGTPVVAWPGRFMRGRITAGAYRQMAIADAPVVGDIADYAPRAIALGRDPDHRRTIREASLAAARRHLFDDLGAVRELEAFLEAAVDAAARGDRLPQGWQPPRSGLR